MRRRVHKPAAVAVSTVPVRGAARLVTLEDPSAGTRLAQDAFARLRPGEGMTPEDIASWRVSVARVARAVKVLPALRSEDVPAAAARAGEEPPGTVREEAIALAQETGNPHVPGLVTRLLDEAGA